MGVIMFVEIVLKLIFVVLATTAFFSLVEWLANSHKQHYLETTCVLACILALIMFIISIMEGGVTQKQLKKAIEKCGTIENVETMYYNASPKCINPQLEEDQHVHD
jgi:uncharacterized protein YacL